MSSSNTTFTTVMRGVADALKLDGDNKVQDAYMKYLECILRICTKLLQDVRLGGNISLAINKETVKMVRLGQQCMDRVATVVNQIDSKTLTSGSVQGPIKKNYRSGSSKSEPSTPSETLHFNPITDEGLNIPKDQSPLEQAYKQNQLLMMAYKARMARMDPKRRMATSLTIQRKMAENLAIAKVQEEALKKKMEERQQRLEEQAARRFGTPTGLTDDDKEQRQTYKQVLEYEQEHVVFWELRKQLDEKPSSPELINKLLLEILRSPNHPLTKKLKTHSTKIHSKLEHLVEGKMEIIDAIKVPLAKYLYPKHLQRQSCGQDGSSCTDDEKQSIHKDSDEKDKSGDENESKKNDENDSSELNIVKESLEEDESDNEINDKWEPNFTGSSETDMEQVEANVRENIEEAIDMGEKETKKLEGSVRKAAGILHQISQEYDKYNQDNMDELFDDDDDDDNRDENDNEGTESANNVDFENEIKGNAVGERKKSEIDEISCGTSLADFRAVELKIKNLKNEAYQRHVKGIADDIHLFMEKMLVLFTVCYEQLDCIEGKDQCYASLEKATFQPIWKHLLALYRLANEPKELALAYVMTEKSNCSPEDCTVHPKLQLGKDDAPYHSVIDHLNTLPNQLTLLDKLECLVKCSRLVCQCLEEYYKDQKVPTVGADDLLPILSYVIIKSGRPELISECMVLEEFIHEGYIMGEEGYCLTSIQTAVGYLVSQGTEE